MNNYLDKKLLKETQKNLDEAEAMLGTEASGSHVEDHSCNFCDSTDTTEYSAEGNGSVWICEDCRSVGNGDSADL